MTPDKLSEVEADALMHILLEAIRRLGWDVAFPGIGDDDEVPGMIIGTNEYVYSILKQLPEDEEYGTEKDKDDL